MNATSTLGALSTDLASVVAATARSVVYVDAHPRRDASGIVWDEHHVVTVAHAIDREDDIDLLLGAGGTARAVLVGIDRATDIAVVRTETSLVPLPRNRKPEVAVGNIVLAIARDEDDATGASFGIVSSLDGAWQTWRGGKIDRFIRPDLSVYPAFSGGPLVDAEGTTIGMNTWGLSRRNAITLPMETLERVAGEIVSHGRVSRGYLGVAMQPVRGGAIIVDVASGGPAERGGLLIGDVITAIGNVVIEDSDDVQRALASTGAGSDVTLKIVRAGNPHAVTLTLGERPRDGE